MTTLDDHIRTVLNIIGNERCDYNQKVGQLRNAAESLLSGHLNISSTSQEYFKEGILCDLFEGPAPYRPRYILPDYQKFLQLGSEYLNLPPASDLLSALHHLLIIYKYVPSITGLPVFLGAIDELLEPWIVKKQIFNSDEEIRSLLKYFIIHIDRTLPNAFVHINIGPKETKLGNIWLELENELKQSVPNLSFKYDPKFTSDHFFKKAITLALNCGKPYFINHNEFNREWGDDNSYGIASCYNTLKIGGGAHTLVRMNLKKLAQLWRRECDNPGQEKLFFEKYLPSAVKSLAEVINVRAKFIVEDSKFFQSSFLVREGFIDLQNFTAMAGFLGLYECVEILSESSNDTDKVAEGGKEGRASLGRSSNATKLSHQILSSITQILNTIPAPYCPGSNGRIVLHAQSGIESDQDVTPGVRVKIGQEPVTIFEQLNLAAELQPYFKAGASDIYIFEPTARNNLEATSTIVKRALEKGVRILSLNSKDSELVRVSGFLVKKSDIKKYWAFGPLRDDSVKLGAESIRNGKFDERKVW